MRYASYFFDIRKAFDSVPHTQLLQKLLDIGLNPYLLRWIENYLTNREQFTVVNGYSSTSLSVLSGVPLLLLYSPLLLLYLLYTFCHCTFCTSEKHCFFFFSNNIQKILCNMYQLLFKWWCIFRQWWQWSLFRQWSMFR